MQSGGNGGLKSSDTLESEILKLKGNIESERWYAKIFSDPEIGPKLYIIEV